MLITEAAGREALLSRIKQHIKFQIDYQAIAEKPELLKRKVACQFIQNEVQYTLTVKAKTTFYISAIISSTNIGHA